MNIDLTPINNIMGSLHGIPPALFYAIAFAMTLYAVRELWGYFVKYVFGLLLIYYLMLHPTVVNAAVQYVAQVAVQLSRS